MSGEKITVVVDAVVASLIPVFLENRQQDVIKLTKLLDQEDYESIRITGHNLKGCGTSYGFQYITDIGALIETAANQPNRLEIARNIEGLKTYLDNIEIEYTS